MHTKTKLAVALIVSLPVMASYAAKNTDGEKIDLSAIEARLSALESSNNPSVADSTYRVLVTLDVTVHGTYQTYPAISTRPQAENYEFSFSDEITGTGMATRLSCSIRTAGIVFPHVIPPVLLMPEDPCSLTSFTPSFNYTQDGNLLTIDFGDGPLELTVSTDGGVFHQVGVFSQSLASIIARDIIGIRLTN